MSLLPSFAEQRLEPVADSSRWQLSLSWDGESATATSRDFLALPEFRHQAAWSWADGPSSGYTGQASLTLASSSAVVAWMAQRAMRQPDFAPVATLALKVGDYPADERVVLRGRLRRWSVGATMWRVEIEAAWPWDSEVLLCRDLALLPTGLASAVRGPRWLPQVFGEVGGVRLARLAPGDPVGLRTRLDRTHPEVVLEHLPEGWPASGNVQVNDEAMTYAGVADGPPRLVGLVRSTPRDHAANARAMWLPVDGPAWIAADHQALVLEVATASQPTLALADASVDLIELDGRTATRVALARWPVSQREGATVLVEEEPSKASHWLLDGSSSALNPELAWGEPDAPHGVVFTRGATGWRATAKRPADATELRFGRIERARLRCDVAFASTWTTAETLMLRVRRGAALVEKPLLRSEDVARQLEGAVAVATASLGDVTVPVPADLLRFASAVPYDNERWMNAAAAIDGDPATTASLIHDSEEQASPLALGLGTLVEGDGRRVRRYVVRVLASLPGASALVSASLETPDFSVSTTVSAAPEFSWLSLTLELPPGEHAVVDLLAEGTRLSINLVGEGELLVGDVALQVEYEPWAIGVPSSAVALPLNTTQGASFATYELDVTDLLTDPHDWTAFDGTLEAELQLASLVNGQRAEVRHLHWVFDVRPAASVRLETELVATVRGRLADSDGACDPVAVVEALWSNADLLGQPAGEFDPDASQRARAVVALAGRRFRAAFAQQATTDSLMRRALAEAGLVLAPADAGWALGAVDALVADPTQATLEPGHVIALADARPSEAPPLAARRVVMRRSDQRVVADVVRGVGEGEQHVAAMWLDAGAASLVACGIDRAGYRRERLRWRARPAWWWTPLGGRLAVDLSDQGLADGDVIVDALEHVRGETWLEGWIAAPWLVVRVDALEVRREFAGPRLVFVVDGRVWALFDAAGDLHIGGLAIGSQPVGPFAAGPGFSSDGGVGLTFGTLGAGAMAVGPEGDLRVAGSITTGVALEGPGPTTGWLSTAEGLSLGTLELGVVAFLDAATGNLSLRGQVRGLVG